MIGIKPPPKWTTMNAVRDYEKAMTHTNEKLTPPIFTSDESTILKTAKDRIEKLLPSWVRRNPNIVVAGGVWASTLHSDGFKDIDVFILDCPNLDKDLIRGQITNWYEDGEDKTDDYVRNNEKVTEVWTSKRSKIQFIFTKHQTRKELIEDFDYVHCKTSYTEGSLYITRKIFDAIKNKHLIVNNPKNIQQWRKSKFRDRGYVVISKEAEEPTLGDILSNMLNNKVTPAPYQEDYIPW